MPIPFIVALLMDALSLVAFGQRRGSLTLGLANGRIRDMDAREFALRNIKDRVAAALGSIDEAAPEPGRKENFRRLTHAASELHRCADEIQSILMRIKTR